jgi:hypothetical protein
MVTASGLPEPPVTAEKQEILKTVAAAPVPPELQELPVTREQQEMLETVAAAPVRS